MSAYNIPQMLADQLGWLMVNRLGELGAHDANSALAEAYRDSFRAAFGMAWC